MTNKLIIVDNNMLSQLYAAGGTKAWDSFFKTGKVMLPSVIFDEASIAPYRNDFLSWYKNNESRIDFKRYNLEEINAYYGTNYTLGDSKGAGDASIRYFVDSGDAKGLDYILASSDGKLINYFDINLKSSPYQGVLGYLSTQLWGTARRMVATFSQRAQKTCIRRSLNLSSSYIVKNSENHP